MKKIAVLFLCFLLSVNCFATVIVIYITPDFVIMAADSRGNFTNGKTMQQNVKAVSKIYKSGNFYFSLSGLISNNLRSFNASTIINTSLKNGKNLKTSIAQVKLNLKAALKQYLVHQKKNNYNLYKKNISSGDYYITSVGLITLNNKKPYAHLLGFRITNEKDLTITVDEVFYDGSSKEDAVYYLGKTDEINKYMDTVQKIKGEPSLFVENLIKVQAKKTPEYVGFPIDMIKITPKATVWIKKQKATPVILN